MAGKCKDTAERIYNFIGLLKDSYSPDLFFQELMLIYGCSSETIQKALDNDRKVNVACEVIDKDMARSDLALAHNVYLRFVKHDEDVESAFLKVLELNEFKNKKNNIKFIICSGPTTLYLYDRIEKDALTIKIDDLKDYYHFLLPMSDGRGNTPLLKREDVNKKACIKFTRLLDALASHNNLEEHQLMQLSSFIRRIIFCIFAFDMGMFGKGYDSGDLFLSTFTSLVDKKGANAKEFFLQLFLVLRTREEDRGGIKDKVNKQLLLLPYADIPLLKEDNIFIPEFNVAARNCLCECIKLSFKDISPAIFISMFKSSMKKGRGQESSFSCTSTDNIKKIIRPLFLDRLYGEFEKLKEDTKYLLQKKDMMPLLNSKREKSIEGYDDYLSDEAIRLDREYRQCYRKFLLKIGSLKFLDPSCSSGSLLTVTYQELRDLENDVLAHIRDRSFSKSYINPDNFCGIDIDMWSVQLSELSMYLVEHLMNLKTGARLSIEIKTLPYVRSGTFIAANALTSDWGEVLSPQECSYIIGSVPGCDAENANDEQIKWIKDIFPEKAKTSGIDLAGAWYVKASDYMHLNKNIETAFAATEAICQGEQVSKIWGHLFDRRIRINFAYRALPWTDSNSDKDDNTRIITAFSYKDNDNKLLYLYDRTSNRTRELPCTYISPYLLNCKEAVVISPQKKAVSAVLKLEKGNVSADNGHLILELHEGRELMEKYPQTKPYIKRLLESFDIRRADFRYCLWLTEDQMDRWSAIPEIMDRVNQCAAWRAKKAKKSIAYHCREKPWAFNTQHISDNALVIPCTVAQSAFCIPVDFVKKDTVVSDAAFILQEAGMYELGILSSRMHMVWMRLSCDKRGSQYIYSDQMCFRSFVWPQPAESTRNEIVECAKKIKLVRSRRANKSLNDMYNADTMHPELKSAHEALDLLVERSYRLSPFINDNERAEFLLELYARAIPRIYKRGRPTNEEIKRRKRLRSKVKQEE